jgi:adenine-specific DNA glycosylase
MAFAFGEPYLAWDTNLEKVFARYYNGNKTIKLTEEEKTQIEEDFKKFIDSSMRTKNGDPNEIVRAINNALMDFASIVDLKNPLAIDWDNYPIKSGKWYETR